MIGKVIGTLCAALVISASTLAANPPHPRSIDRREHRQAQRIREGWRDGQLTRAERERLVAEQAAIRAEERVYRRDGGLNRWERRDLQRDLNRASRDIWIQKHDAQRRWK